MEIKETIQNYKENMIKDLQEWIKKDSVFDEKTITKDAPFGKGVKNSLDYIAEVAKRDGFKVTNYDGYVTEIEFGKGKELIGIFGHGDVVPEGKGWIHKPYGAEIENNLIYGRGSSDDKGPTIAAYYALKMLKEAGYQPNKTIRLVVGGNEERGSACLDYYFNKIKRPHPTYGFTPDADFPLIYGEKGLISYHYYGKFDDSCIKSIVGGVVSNAVIDEAIFEFKEEIIINNKFTKLCKKYGLKFEYNKKKLKFIGKASHAAMPENGINAFSLGLVVLSKTTNSELAKYFGPKFEDYYGKGLGICYKTKEMGKLTIIQGLAKYEKGNYDFNINIRYPRGKTYKEICQILDKNAMQKGELLGFAEPLYVDPNSKFIQTLLKAYQDVTKDYKTKPMTIGGGTYAKETKNTVAFGMDFHRLNGSGNIHSPEEAINIDDLLEGCEIYYKAIKGLCEL